MIYTNLEIDNSFQICKQITKRSSSTFYLGAQFFPRELRNYIWALYAFCRTTDDLVDTLGVSKERQLQELHTREKILEFVFDNDSDSHRFCEIYPDILLTSFDSAIVCGLVQIRKNNPNFQKKPFMELLSGMRMDISKLTYKTYDELSVFSNKSAGSVGEMICNLCGISDSMSLGYAHVLGESMQFTNILRDIGEDFGRGRVYIPDNDLIRYDIDLARLLNRAKEGRWNTIGGETDLENRFREMMRFLISINHNLYVNAQEGVNRLPYTIRRPVQIALYLYQGILDQIEKNDFNVFTKRAFVPMSLKIKTVLLSQF